MLRLDPICFISGAVTRNLKHRGNSEGGGEGGGEDDAYNFHRRDSIDFPRKSVKAVKALVHAFQVIPDVPHDDPNAQRYDKDG